MNVLSIDPGRRSGWCLWADRYVASGHLDLSSRRSAGLLHDVVLGAIAAGASVMLIEDGYPMGPACGWKTHYGLGRYRGRWEQAALLAGMRIEDVPPRTWQAPTIGSGRHDAQVAKYTARAMAATGRPVDENEAAAVVMAQWYVTEQRRKA